MLIRIVAHDVGAYWAVFAPSLMTACVAIESARATIDQYRCTRVMNREGSRKRKRRVGKARSTALLQTPATDSAAADVGILVVHGIGKQEPVETLDSLASQ